MNNFGPNFCLLFSIVIFSLERETVKKPNCLRLFQLQSFSFGATEAIKPPGGGGTGGMRGGGRRRPKFYIFNKNFSFLGLGTQNALTCFLNLFNLDLFLLYRFLLNVFVACKTLQKSQ